MNRYPRVIPGADFSIRKADPPPRPGVAQSLALWAEQNGWHAKDVWTYRPKSITVDTYMLDLTWSVVGGRAYYTFAWKRRQPTFDFGWWSRGKIIQCPPGWPKLHRTNMTSLRRVQWVLGEYRDDAPGLPHRL